MKMISRCHLHSSLIYFYYCYYYYFRILLNTGTHLSGHSRFHLFTVEPGNSLHGEEQNQVLGRGGEKLESAEGKDFLDYFFSFMEREAQAKFVLQELNLNQNAIVVIPPEIGQLKSLVKLYLALNKIQKFPAEGSF